MFQHFFSNISNAEKNKAVEQLFTLSSPNKDFFLMITLSVLMATFGLLVNSVAVIIGSMLIAPLLYPILSVAMGINMSDPILISRSTITLVKATVLSIVAATITTLLFGSQFEGYSSEIIARTSPSLIYVAIGAVAGMAAAFSTVKPQMNEALPGVAVSVALIPPLAVVGIGLAHLDFVLAFDALLLFLINAAGVIFTSLIVFSLMNFYTKRNLAEEVVKEEEKKIEKEN